MKQQWEVWRPVSQGQRDTNGKGAKVSFISLHGNAAVRTHSHGADSNGPKLEHDCVFWQTQELYVAQGGLYWYQAGPGLFGWPMGTFKRIYKEVEVTFVRAILVTTTCRKQLNTFRVVM